MHPDFDTKTYGARSYTELIKMLTKSFEIKKNDKGHYMFRPVLDKE